MPRTKSIHTRMERLNCICNKKEKELIERQVQLFDHPSVSTYLRSLAMENIRATTREANKRIKENKEREELMR